MQALVLGGGSIKGAFQAGALEEILARGFAPLCSSVDRGERGRRMSGRGTSWWLAPATERQYGGAERGAPRQQ